MDYAFTEEQMALCAYPITVYGTSAQKEKYLAAFARGQALGSSSWRIWP